MMKTMILGLFGVSLAGALAEMLLIDKEGRGARRALRLMTSLAVLLVILSPLADFLRGGYEVDLAGLAGQTDATLQAGYQAVFEEAVAAESEDLLTEGVLEFLQEEFGIDRAHAAVRVQLAADGTLHGISVTLSGAALLKNPDEIREALTEMLSCTVEVR